jgi:plastocyanin domain-containing protein
VNSFNIVKSLSREFVYFIFREDDQEIEFSVHSGMIKSKIKLTPDEVNYIRNKIL